VDDVSALRAEIQPYRLPFRRPFVTAFGTFHHRSGWILCIRDAQGHQGYGEAAPLPGFGGGDPTQVERDLQHLLAFAQTLPEAPATPASLARLIHALATESAVTGTPAPAALAALDLALADLAARRAGLPLAQWLAPETASPSVPVNATIGGQSPADSASAAEIALAAGYRSLKLKLSGDDELDLARIAAVHAVLAAQTRVDGPPRSDMASDPPIRPAAGDSAIEKETDIPPVEQGPPRLRLDANGAWPLPRALRMIDRLSPYTLSNTLNDTFSSTIEYIEQPTPVTGRPEEDVAALIALSSASPIPIAADEILLDPRAADLVLAQRAAAVLILKPALLGGPSITLDLAGRSREAGLSPVITTALDAAIGRLGALHLAAALGLTRPCGLATGSLLAQDLAPTPEPHQGHMHLPTAPGLGVTPKR
jgi:L-alanine-DL-glutamate epimerase-like enolase superfamily enzyme